MPVYLSSQSFSGLGGYGVWIVCALSVLVILGVGLYLDITKGQKR